MERAEHEVQATFERARAKTARSSEFHAQSKQRAKEEAKRLARVRKMEVRRQVMKRATPYFRGELKGTELKAGLSRCMESGMLILEDLPESIQS